jgi:nucleoside-diphosphate-sugar epimerase
MKISILGTNGLLSSAIASYCCQQHYLFDMYGLEEPYEKGYHSFSKIDILNEKLNYAKLSDSDIIVYAIGAGIQSNLKESAELIYKLNLMAPIDISLNLRKNNYKGVFITFGSVFEIGKTREIRLITEEDILISQYDSPNDYVVSKRMLSRFVSSYNHEYTHWHFYIPTIYSEKENPCRLIPYTINAIKTNQLLSFTAGDQTRQYIHVSEIPAIIDLAYNKNLANGIYNISGIEILTVKEIVTLIHKKLNKNIPENCFGKAQRDDVEMKYLALDGSKLYNILEYQPSIKIKDIISNY